MIKGYNDSEKYLAAICERTFLSLYSYPNVFGKREPAMELCDLLVVVGDDIIIFSDKSCAYGKHPNPETNWSHWVRNAIFNSKKQLVGAEKTIRNFPNEIYLDAKKAEKFPIPISITNATRFHLILTAHGTREACQNAFGGRGSLMLDTTIKSQSDHKECFRIGDISEGKTFIHIFDDATFEVLLTTLDTVTDFVDYLTKRRKFLTSGFTAFATGEEQLLAKYLKTMNLDGEHDFDYPPDDSFDGLFLEEGFWENFYESELYLKKMEADKISRFWDNLIEEFSKHARNGTQDYVSSGGFFDAEFAIRFLAKESRFSRRTLSNQFIEILSLPLKPNARRIRMSELRLSTGLVYIFGSFPHRNPKKQTLRQYRDFRRDVLESYSYVARLLQPAAKFVIAIGMESGLDTSKQSEDLICFDCSSWNDDLQRHAFELHSVHRLLKTTTRFEQNYSEYPNS